MNIQSEISDDFLRPADGADYRHLFTHGFFRFGVLRRGDRLFFVKSLRRDLADSALYRLMLSKEYKLLLKLNHPSVVRVFDFTTVAGEGEAILMEYVAGETLGDFLRSAPPRRMRRRIAAQLVDAVAYIHRQGIVHRDLTPYNIMIVPDAETCVKIIDFGLSDAPDMAFLKGAGGTPGFAAPEQLREGYVPCPESDVWALGRILRLLRPGIGYRLAASAALRDDPARRPASASALRRRVRMTSRLLTVALSVLAALCVAGAVVALTWHRPEAPKTAAITAPVTVERKVADSDTLQGEPVTPPVTTEEPMEKPEEKKDAEKPGEMDRLTAEREELLEWTKEEYIAAIREMRDAWKTYDGTKPSAAECNGVAVRIYMRYFGDVSRRMNEFSQRIPQDIAMKLPKGWISYDCGFLKEYYEAFVWWGNRKTHPDEEDPYSAIR